MVIQSPLQSDVDTKVDVVGYDVSIRSVVGIVLALWKQLRMAFFMQKEVSHLTVLVLW